MLEVEFDMELHRPSWAASVRRATAWLLFFAGTCGCASAPQAFDREAVAAVVVQRTGYSVGPVKCQNDLALPNGASLDDGLSQDEAVLIALWNNALFQELLTDLGVARGDLVQAGLLPNPEVGYFFAVPDKPFKYVVDMPLEALWLRPIRVEAARRESWRVGRRLTQSALDLIRDARQGYADVLLALGRLRVAEEGVRIREEIVQIAQTRLDAGEIDFQEAATARIDLLQARQAALRTSYEIPFAEERLRNLLGLGQQRPKLELVDDPAPLRSDLDVESLAVDAAASRPDAQAALQNSEAAAERLRLARVSWIRFLGILDATSGRNTGHEFGPAFRTTLPIFNWNEGAIARAEAELEKADRQRLTVRNQILLDVHQAHARYEQSRAEWELLEQRVLPEADGAVERSRLAFREGNTPYLAILEATRQLLASRLRQEELRAELKRNWAELERSVGHRIENQTRRVELVPPPDRTTETNMEAPATAPLRIPRTPRDGDLPLPEPENQSP